MEEPQEQKRKHNYDWLNGYKFVKGKSGNPGGRPKGSKSLKTFAREYLERLPDEEKIKFLEALPEEIVWRMAEGNPESKTDLTTKGQPLVYISDAVAKKNAIEVNDNPHTETERDSE